MFHCFHISKHVSISVLFFIISVSCFVFFAGFLKIIAPGVGFWHDFSAPVVGVSHFLCARGVGNSPFQKIPRGFARGWSGLELTDNRYYAWKIDYPKIAKIRFVQFRMFNFEIVYLTQFELVSIILMLKSAGFGDALLTMKEIMKNSTKDFCHIVGQTPILF